MAETISIDVATCLGCGQCVLVCDVDALVSKFGLAVVDPEQCVACGDCIDACPVNAIEPGGS